MSSQLAKVKPGNPLRIPAATFNAFVDAAVAHRQSRHDQSAGSLAGLLRPTLVPVRNDSGVDVPRFGVLGIDAVVITADENLEAFCNQVTLTGVTPDPQVHRQRFVVTHEPITAGAIGAAYVVGVCPAKVDVSVEDHLYAEVVDGQVQHLASAADGAVDVLWKQAGTGIKWAIVRLPQQPSSAAGQAFKLVGGPDGGGRYSAIKQDVLDAGSFADSSDATVYKVLFIGVVNANLPSAESGAEDNCHGQIVWGIPHGVNSSGDPIWHAYGQEPGLELLKAPPEDPCEEG